MASVKEGLIEARSMIDTPAKFRTTSVLMAVLGTSGNNAVWTALREAVPEEFVSGDGEYDHTRQYQYTTHHTTTHDDILALFDRAISAQP